MVQLLGGLGSAWPPGAATGRPEIMVSQETHLLADLGPSCGGWGSLQGPRRVQLTHRLGHRRAQRPRWGRAQHAAGFLAVTAWLLPREMSTEA